MIDDDVKVLDFFYLEVVDGFSVGVSENKFEM